MVVSLIHMRCVYVNLFVVYDLVVCGLRTVFGSSECVRRACNLCNDRVPTGHLVWHFNVAYLTYSTHFIVFFVLLCFFLLFCNEFFLSFFFHWFMFAFAWNDLYKIACNRFISLKLEFILQAHGQSPNI